jgi:hypothetical protein
MQMSGEEVQHAHMHKYISDCSSLAIMMESDMLEPDGGGPA